MIIYIPYKIYIRSIYKWQCDVTTKHKSGNQLEMLGEGEILFVCELQDNQITVKIYVKRTMFLVKWSKQISTQK